MDLAKILPATVAIGIAVVSAVYTRGSLDADLHSALAKATSVEQRLEQHISSHAIDSQRVVVLEARAGTTDETLRELSRTIQRLDGNLIAVCAATRGATCVR